MSKRPKPHDRDRELDELVDLSMNLARKAADRASKARTLDEIESCVAEFERLTLDVCASISLRDEMRRERELQRDIELDLADEVAGPRVLH